MSLLIDAARLQLTSFRPALMVAESNYGPEYITTIGVCAGSGGSFLKGSQADLWWTGEMQHHDILATVASGTHVVLCEWSQLSCEHLV